MAFKTHKITIDGIVSAIVMLFQHNQLDDKPHYAAFVLNHLMLSDKVSAKVFKNEEFQYYLKSEYEAKHIAVLQKNLRDDLSRMFSEITTNLLNDDNNSRGNIKYL
jgi:hypothetical protein